MARTAKRVRSRRTVRVYILRRRGDLWAVYWRNRRAPLGEWLVLAPAAPEAVELYFADLTDGRGVMLRQERIGDDVRRVISSPFWHR